MTMRSFSSRLVVLAALHAPAALSAQGTLSTQGFGYPTGQNSTRSLGAAGALAENDPLSVTNPATLITFCRERIGAVEMEVETIVAELEDDRD